MSISENDNLEGVQAADPVSFFHFLNDCWTARTRPRYYYVISSGPYEIARCFFKRQFPDTNQIRSHAGCSCVEVYFYLRKKLG